MSVPAYKRSESTMEFISYARDLLKFTVHMCSKIPKKYTFYGVIHTYKYAQAVLNNLIKANNLDLKTYYQKRTELLDDALERYSASINGFLKFFNNRRIINYVYN